MAGIENLKPIRSEEEAREKGKNGGIKSGETRRRKRAIKESLDILLSKDFKPTSKSGKKLVKELTDIGVNPDEIDYQMVLSYAMFEVATSHGKGAVAAFNSIRDTLGEKPTDNIKIGQDEPFEVNIKVVK